MDFKKIFSFENKWFRRLNLILWITFITMVICIPVYITSVANNWAGVFGGMPSIRALENPENDLSSELISADGVSLGRYFRFNRSQVAYHDLSDDLINTLIISEDHRFHNHSGLDFIAYLRVFRGLITLRPAGGGSTITQQLAKNLFRTREGELDGKLSEARWIPGFIKSPILLVVRKTKEWVIAVRLETNFTKEEIIAMYLNTVDFSSNAYGIKVATETYFNKQPKELNLQESALLVGMLQGATLFNPVRNPNNAFKKRNEVLYKIHKHGYKIDTKAEFDSISALPIELEYNVQNQNKGLATYFRAEIGKDLLRWCRENGIDLYESGLKIYTTIDSKMQQYAEEAVTQHMKPLQNIFDEHWKGRNPWIDDEKKEIPNFLDMRIKQTDAYKKLVAKYGADSDSVMIMLKVKKPMTVFSWNGEIDTLFSSYDSLNYYKRFLHAGLVSMDPQTGSIKAWVGGIDFKYFKYDHVRQGKRQPGSTFKPFVYGAAIENGYAPCYELYDVSPAFKVSEGVWHPPNADGTRGSGKKMNLRQAMARSVNSITAQIMQALGEKNVVEFAHRVGIESFLDPVPSLCLGTSDVSIYELVGAYSTFVNSGIYTQPYYISRIEDKYGNVLVNFVPKTRQAISEQTAYKMIYMLQGGVEEEGGTSRGLNMELKIDNEIGGKTGTTNNASDGWYVGVTKNLVTGIWVGGDEKFIHFREWVMGQGGRTARPIWEIYMKKVYEDKDLGYTKGQFRRPTSGIDVSLDCSKYIIDEETEEILEEDIWDIDTL
ncbi:MAG TPA: transglycosylase domain-containing protein [Cyclobacteriaceae bacterium]|mgnify:CR=1 FL=1|nr:transglycosylase domain-containing protein [Cyclobacteriaceae bacterium]